MNEYESLPACALTIQDYHIDREQLVVEKVTGSLTTMILCCSAVEYPYAYA